MKAKTTKPSAAAPPKPAKAKPLTFSEWKRAARVPAETVRWMRPADLRALFFNDTPPEEVASYFERSRYNAKDAPPLRGKR